VRPRKGFDPKARIGRRQSRQPVEIHVRHRVRIEAPLPADPRVDRARQRGGARGHMVDQKLPGATGPSKIASPHAGQKEQPTCACRFGLVRSMAK